MSPCVPVKDSKIMRMRWRLRTMLIAVPVIGLTSAIIPACDAVTHGPYSSWFNQRYQSLANKAQLIGKTESQIIPILGPPTFFYPGDNDSQRTYNYAPVWYCPTAKFQVHCVNGIVIGVEQFDD
jgi:hypothetical protein